jgi:AraC-like DNA-binding protein
LSSIVILQTNPVACGRIRRAIALEDAGRVRHAARWCNCWDELTATAIAVPSDLAIIDPFHPSPAGNGLASFARRFPNVGLIAYGDFAGRPAADVVALVHMGVSAVLTLEVDDDPVGIARVMAQGTTQQAFRPVCRALTERYGGILAPLLERLLDAAVEPMTPDEISERLGHKRRTLERLLAAHGLPPPSRLFTWFQLFHAVRLLEDPARTMENVAFSLGFGSGSALSSTGKRYTGFRLREIVRRGGVSYLTGIMLSRLDDAGNECVDGVGQPHSEQVRVA